MKFWKVFLDNWGKKIVSLIFAVGLFFYVSNMKTAERLINVPVMVRNQPGFLMPVKPIPKTVAVKISGMARTIALIETEQITASVDMGTAAKGLNTFIIELEHDDFPEDVSVSLSQKTIKVRMDVISEKNLRIEPVILNEPAEGYVIRERTINPGWVRVVGPASVLNNMDRITTEAINIAGIRQDMSKRIRLDKRGYSIRIKNQASIILTIDIEQEEVQKTFEQVPVKIVSSSNNLQMVSPEQQPLTSITVRGGRNTLEQLKADDIQAHIDLSPFQKAGQYNVPVLVSKETDFDVVDVVPSRIPVRLESINNP